MKKEKGKTKEKTGLWGWGRFKGNGNKQLASSGYRSEGKKENFNEGQGPQNSVLEDKKKHANPKLCINAVL
jgi:hypothetical protein